MQVELHAREKGPFAGELGGYDWTIPSTSTGSINSTIDTLPHHVDGRGVTVYGQGAYLPHQFATFVTKTSPQESYEN